jgi:hypothetical protein
MYELTPYQREFIDSEQNTVMLAPRRSGKTTAIEQAAKEAADSGKRVAVIAGPSMRRTLDCNPRIHVINFLDYLNLTYRPDLVLIDEPWGRLVELPYHGVLHKFAGSMLAWNRRDTMYRLFRQAYKDKAGLWRVINVSAEDVPFTNYDVLERELSRDSYRVTKNALSAVR